MWVTPRCSVGCTRAWVIQMCLLWFVDTMGVPHGVMHRSKVLCGVHMGLGDPIVLYGVHGHPEVLHYFHRSMA